MLDVCGPAVAPHRVSGSLRQEDADAYHHRAHALASLSRFPEVIADLAGAIRLRPDDAHYRVMRGGLYRELEQFEPAITDLEAALALNPDQPRVEELLARCCNNRAWELAKGPGPGRDLDRALALSRRALALAPGEAMSLNTMGIVHYRAGLWVEAIATLERSLAAGRGQAAGCDRVFLAMADQRLGHRDEARACFDRALRWLEEQKTLNARSAQELAGFRAEAEAEHAGPAGELPEDVFSGTTPR